MNYHTFGPLFVFYFNVKFLQQKDPTDEFGLGIFLGDKMSNDNMINIYYHLITDKIYPKLIKGKYYSNQLFSVVA
jgi:hypothetical protein